MRGNAIAHSVPRSVWPADGAVAYLLASARGIRPSLVIQIDAAHAAISGSLANPTMCSSLSMSAAAASSSLLQLYALIE